MTDANMNDANWNMTAILPTLTPTIIFNGDPDATLEIKFNTGREYTAEGQVIYAKVKAGMVYFVDTARGMDGRFRPLVEVDDAKQLMRAAMWAYDFDTYESAHAVRQYRHAVSIEGYGEGKQVKDRVKEDEVPETEYRQRWKRDAYPE